MARSSTARRPSKAVVTSNVIELDTDAIAAKERAQEKVSDADILAHLNERFDILTEMTKAVKKGDVRAMIVSGPPGVGKSHNVEAVLQKDGLFDTLGERKPKYEVVKGLEIDEYSQGKIKITLDELEGERAGVQHLLG